jgi:predicted phosphodiesterase
MSNQIIEVYELSGGELVGTFNNTKEVAKFIKGDSSTVSKVLKGKRKHHKGYTFKYASGITPNEVISETTESSEKEYTKKQTKIGDISHVDDDPKYNFDNGNYTWVNKYTNNEGSFEETVELSLEQADKLFFEYSKFGMNLTEMEVRIKNNVSIRNWNAIKSRLTLYKQSDIFSPVTRNELTIDEYRELVRKKLDELSTFKNRLVVDEYNKYQIKEAEKVIGVATNKRFIVDSMLSNLSEWINERNNVNYINVNVNDKADTERLIVCLADLHIGADIVDEYNHQEYNTEILTKRLKTISDRINARNSKEVVVMLGGDIIHSFTGTMHKTIFKDMEKNISGTNIVKLAVDVLEEFLRSINNLKRVLSVSGNHDRMSNDFKEDSNGAVCEMIMYILERSFGRVIDIKHDNYIVSEQIGGVNYIMTHGHNKSISKPETLIHDYGKQNVFNLILSAHLHTRKVNLDTYRSRDMKIPSIYTGDDYASKLGFTSTAGCLFITECDNLPQIEDLSFA